MKHPAQIAVAFFLAVGGNVSFSATLDIAATCNSQSYDNAPVQLPADHDFDLPTTTYCADAKKYWRDLKVVKARIDRNTKMGEYSVSVYLADEQKPLLANIFSSSIGKQLLFIVDGRVISAPFVANAIDGSMFSISVSDLHAGELLMARLTPNP